MKRLLLGLAGALLLVFGPLPSVSAHGWWPWHHHSKSHTDASTVPAGATQKSAKAKDHGERHRSYNTAALYSFPKSVGHWGHQTPGPAGAGSGYKQEGVTQTAQSEPQHKEESSHTSLSQKLFGWWHHHDETPEAVASNGK